MTEEVTGGYILLSVRKYNICTPPTSVLSSALPCPTWITIPPKSYCCKNLTGDWERILRHTTNGAANYYCKLAAPSWCNYLVRIDNWKILGWVDIVRFQQPFADNPFTRYSGIGLEKDISASMLLHCWRTMSRLLMAGCKQSILKPSKSTCFGIKAKDRCEYCICSV